MNVMLLAKPADEPGSGLLRCLRWMLVISFAFTVVSIFLVILSPSQTNVLLRDVVGVRPHKTSAAENAKAAVAATAAAAAVSTTTVAAPQSTTTTIATTSTTTAVTAATTTVTYTVSEAQYTPLQLSESVDDIDKRDLTYPMSMQAREIVHAMQPLPASALRAALPGVRTLREFTYEGINYADRVDFPGGKTRAYQFPYRVPLEQSVPFGSRWIAAGEKLRADVILVTYATNPPFTDTQRKLTETAKRTGFTKVHAWTRQDLQREFPRCFELDKAKGFCHYAFKYFVVRHALRLAKRGDIIYYTDSSRYHKIGFHEDANVRPLAAWMASNEHIHKGFVGGISLGGPNQIYYWKGDGPAHVLRRLGQCPDSLTFGSNSTVEECVNFYMYQRTHSQLTSFMLTKNTFSETYISTLLHAMTNPDMVVHAPIGDQNIVNLIHPYYELGYFNYTIFPDASRPKMDDVTELKDPSLLFKRAISDDDTLRLSYRMWPLLPRKGYDDIVDNKALP